MGISWNKTLLSKPISVTTTVSSQFLILNKPDTYYAFSWKKKHSLILFYIVKNPVISLSKITRIHQTLSLLFFFDKTHILLYKSRYIILLLSKPSKKSLFLNLSKSIQLHIEYLKREKEVENYIDMIGKGQEASKWQSLLIDLLTLKNQED